MNIDVDVSGLLISNCGKLFATNEIQLTDNAIDIFLNLVDHMSCSTDTYVSLGGSNGCADQLTNWDGIQKLGVWNTTQKGITRFILIIKREAICSVGYCKSTQIAEI